MEILRLYGRFIVVYMKTLTEYRLNFVLSQFITIVVYLISFLGVWIVLNKFKVIHGWGFYEIMLLYNLNLFSYGASSLLFRGPMRNLEFMVQDGSFDSILIYPMNPFVNLICREFNHGSIAHSALGAVFFYICFENLSIVWTWMNVVWFGLVLIGATLIQAAIMVLTGTISFWFVRSAAVVDTAIYGLRRFVNYPLGMYDKWVQVLLTFVIPYGFVAFFPAEYFLNKSEAPLFHGITLFDPLFQYGTPLVGIVSFFLAYRLWCVGINRYESTGS